MEGKTNISFYNIKLNSLEKYQKIDPYLSHLFTSSHFLAARWIRHHIGQICFVSPSHSILQHKPSSKTIFWVHCLSTFIIFKFQESAHVVLVREPCDFLTGTPTKLGHDDTYHNVSELSWT